MATEIERKFLVHLADPAMAAILQQPASRIEQGYLLGEDRGVLRVRIIEDTAYLTYKGKTRGLSRPEFEYPIPMADARDLLDHHCYASLKKTRRAIPLENGLVAELDVFEDPALIMVEVELPDAGTAFTPPSWFGQEVSFDPAYFNSALAKPRQ